jgi:hypothetical protein
MTAIERALELLVNLQNYASSAANRLWEKTSGRTIAKFTWTAINPY